MFGFFGENPKKLLTNKRSWDILNNADAVNGCEIMELHLKQKTSQQLVYYFFDVEKIHVYNLNSIFSRGFLLKEKQRECFILFCIQ